MKIHITAELSMGIYKKIRPILNEMETELVYFNNVNYGDDLKNLYIASFCMDDKMSVFFKPRKPQYRKEAKEYLHRGVLVNTPEKTFIYELRLDYGKYESGANIKAMLVNDVILSFDIIKQQKGIKNFDVEGFSAEFKRLFQKLNWI